ncbi:protein BPS1, chloroplastic-like [Arachis stenosperma]|uniref:protein BPS1, chloroplastic-like n=1 Tax=Arachis stenosperma TaxID=217475 RepID=UPI0025AD0273|nr:protein BPS1, chloroplastic-like [Arachis stenosperma]
MDLSYGNAIFRRHRLDNPPPTVATELAPVTGARRRRSFSSSPSLGFLLFSVSSGGSQLLAALTLMSTLSLTAAGLSDGIASFGDGDGPWCRSLIRLYVLREGRVSGGERQDTDTGTLRHKIVFDRGDIDIDIVFRDTELVKNNYPSLDSWKKHIDSRNPRIEKCDGILDNLVGSLDLPKVKKSPKGKVLMQAMYGVKVQTVFVYSVFAAAFSGSTKKLIDLDVAEIYTWVPEFKSLQNLVNEEVTVRFSSGRFTVLKELEAVDSAIKELYPIILDVVEPIETELDLKTVEQLGRATEKLSEGLDLLAKGVNGFFQVVLSGRDALLSNLRSGGIVYDRGSGVI